VASEIDLPGLIAAAPARVAGDDPPGQSPQELPDPTASGATWQIAGKQFLTRIPDIARFLLNDGSEIVVASESEASDADIPVFILGTVFGILLHQREQIVLHASAVRVNGKAVLFCGSSNAGKSTLAAALAQRGYPLVTDGVHGDRRRLGRAFGASRRPPIEIMGAVDPTPRPGAKPRRARAQESREILRRTGQRFRAAGARRRPG
jgi:hypothetical protein